MVAVNDYRVSRVVVLCKDCNEDVGLYPSRHKCKPKEPPPLLPRMRGNGTSPVTPKFSPNSKSITSPNSESKWGKVKQVGNWKDVSNGKEVEIVSDKPTSPSPSPAATPAGSLWDRLLAATSGVSKAVNQMVLHDDGYESDKSDFEGETHVSRILREYYERQYSERSLPKWLIDSRTPKSALDRKKSAKKADEMDDSESTIKSTNKNKSIEEDEPPERTKFSLRDIYDSASKSSVSRTSSTTSPSSSTFRDDSPHNNRSRLGERLLADKKRAMEERRGRIEDRREERELDNKNIDSTRNSDRWDTRSDTGVDFRVSDRLSPASRSDFNDVRSSSVQSRESDRGPMRRPVATGLPSGPRRRDY